MKSQKAYIKLNGEVGEKELPCVEYVDNNYLKNIEKQKNKINEIVLGNKTKKNNDSKKQ
jgi:hypothetical protein